MGKAQLTYYLFEGVLVGTVGGRVIHIVALSGGGGGSKIAPSEPLTVNDVYSTGQKLKGGVRGGPIPLGRYKIHRPAPWGKGRAARLEPESPLPNHRGGFLIHGRGPKGSDGCIVPLADAEFQHLMNGLLQDNGGTLTVLETMGEGRFA